MRNPDDKEEPSVQEDTVPDLEQASSSVRASSGPVFSEEDAAASVMANNSFVPAVVISEKEDPNSGDGQVITAHQVDDGDDPQPHAPARQQSNRPPSPPSATATEEIASSSSNFASNTAPEESGLNTKIMALKDTRKANTMEADGLVNDSTPPQSTSQRKNRKRMIMVGICICLLAVIGIVVAIAVSLSGDDEESRDASFLKNGRTDAPSITTTVKLTPVPTATPTVSTPVPSLIPTPSPTDHPTAEQRFCLQGSDDCGDAPGGLFGLSIGADWKSLSCVADTQRLKCTIVACNEVFPIATPWRILYMVSTTTNQRIELDPDAFELFNEDSSVYVGFPTVRSETEVEIDLPMGFFPNLEDIQVWLESSVIWPFDPMDRLPNQITLSFSPC